MLDILNSREIKSIAPDNTIVLALSRIPGLVMDALSYVGPQDKKLDEKQALLALLHQEIQAFILKNTSKIIHTKHLEHIFSSGEGKSSIKNCEREGMAILHANELLVNILTEIYLRLFKNGTFPTSKDDEFTAEFRKVPEFMYVFDGNRKFFQDIIREISQSFLGARSIKLGISAFVSGREDCVVPQFFKETRGSIHTLLFEIYLPAFQSMTLCHLFDASLSKKISTFCEKYHTFWNLQGGDDTFYDDLILLLSELDQFFPLPNKEKILSVIYLRSQIEKFLLFEKLQSDTLKMLDYFALFILMKYGVKMMESLEINTYKKSIEKVYYETLVGRPINQKESRMLGESPYSSQIVILPFSLEKKQILLQILLEIIAISKQVQNTISFENIMKEDDFGLLKSILGCISDSKKSTKVQMKISYVIEQKLYTIPHAFVEKYIDLYQILLDGGISLEQIRDFSEADCILLEEIFLEKGPQDLLFSASKWSTGDTEVNSLLKENYFKNKELVLEMEEDGSYIPSFLFSLAKEIKTFIGGLNFHDKFEDNLAKKEAFYETSFFSYSGTTHSIFEIIFFFKSMIEKFHCERAEIISLADMILTSYQDFNFAFQFEVMKRVFSCYEEVTEMYLFSQQVGGIITHSLMESEALELTEILIGDITSQLHGEIRIESGVLTRDEIGILKEKGLTSSKYMKAVDEAVASLNGYRDIFFQWIQDSFEVPSKNHIDRVGWFFAFLGNTLSIVSFKNPENVFNFLGKMTSAEFSERIAYLKQYLALVYEIKTEDFEYYKSIIIRFLKNGDETVMENMFGKLDQEANFGKRFLRDEPLIYAISPSEVERKLLALGFVENGGKRHRKFVSGVRTVMLWRHKRAVPIGTLNSIILASGVTCMSQWNRL